MTPLDTSSGDILADRRADYAEMLFAEGEHEAAAGLMMDALERAPGWALGWFRLGEFHEAAGELGAAAEAWRMALRIDPADRAGAALKLALIGAGPMPDAPPGAFVEALFDQYADRFDAALVGKLGYRAPELLAEAIRAAHPGPFRLARDLGCGTGLMGEKLRPLAGRLEGYDISAGMLAKARARGVYDHLGRADLQAPPPELFDPPADLVAAADVLMYIGRLDALATDAARMLEPGGLFAFTVERHAGAEDFALRPSRRYAHSRAYLERLLAAGFEAVTAAGHVIRTDRDAPVEGLVVTAQRR